MGLPCGVESSMPVTCSTVSGAVLEEKMQRAHVHLCKKFSTETVCLATHFVVMKSGGRRTEKSFNVIYNNTLESGRQQSYAKYENDPYSAVLRTLEGTYICRSLGSMVRMQISRSSGDTGRATDPTVETGLYMGYHRPYTVEHSTEKNLYVDKGPIMRLQTPRKPSLNACVALPTGSMNLELL